MMGGSSVRYCISSQTLAHRRMLGEEMGRTRRNMPGINVRARENSLQSSTFQEHNPCLERLPLQIQNWLESHQLESYREAIRTGNS